MKFVIRYCAERIVEINVDNINVAFIIADEGRRNKEVILSVRSE